MYSLLLDEGRNPDCWASIRKPKSCLKLTSGRHAAKVLLSLASSVLLQEIRPFSATITTPPALNVQRHRMRISSGLSTAMCTGFTCSFSQVLAFSGRKQLKESLPFQSRPYGQHQDQEIVPRICRMRRKTNGSVARVVFVHPSRGRQP